MLLYGPAPAADATAMQRAVVLGSHSRVTCWRPRVALLRIALWAGRGCSAARIHRRGGLGSKPRSDARFSVYNTGISVGLEEADTLRRCISRKG
jgi:hypothetical protein